MKNIAKVCATMAIALALTACNHQADTHDADVAAIKATEVQWNADYAAKDLNKITAHYADDATLMAPGMAPSHGKAAIQATVKEMMADPAASLKFDANLVQVARSGDAGFTQGTYTMTATDPATKQVMTDHGSYVTVYTKTADGSWKAVSDIASSSVPPAAPASASKK